MDKLNKNFYRKNSDKIANWRLTFNKSSSAEIYECALRRFCKEIDVTPNELARKPLDEVEDLTEMFIHQNKGKLSPKYLNVVYCSIKSWCLFNKKIKNTAQFRQIKFDKSSRKTDALTETMLETKHIKTSFKIANLEDQVDWGLYGLCGLRPRIIPQLAVRDLYSKNYEIVDGKLRFTVRPPLMIIPQTYAGNKGNITFMVFIPSKLAELVEMQLNANDKITPETRISESDNKAEIYYKIKCLFKHPSINFKGRPYLLRSYADRILERITHQFNEEDFKEFLMGHRGKISAIYQIKALTKEDEERYREMYVEACDKWISQNIFETVSREKIDKGEMLIAYSQQIADIDQDKLRPLKQAFVSGKLSTKTLQIELGKLTRQALDKTMEAKFEQLYLKMEAKHNNH